MAEVKGKNGRAVVKIGPALASPSGYSNSDIKASGTDYCVWSKVDTGDDYGLGYDADAPKKLYFLGNIEGKQWTTSA